MKIGIVLPNWIGDVVMATPTLRAIRQHFGPEADIAGIMRPYVSKVLEGTNWLNRAFPFDRRSTDPELRSRGLLRRLYAWNPDAIVLLTNSLWAAAMGWMCGATTRVGYARNGRGPLLSTRLQAQREGGKYKPISAVDYYLELAYALGCPTESPRLELATLPQDELGADQVWRNLGLDQAQRVIVFNTGSAVGSAKHWPQEYYVELARRIVATAGDHVLIICGPGERDTARQIEQLTKDPRIRSMADQDLSLGVAKACVRRCDLMVTTDSGPRHFAPAFDVPVVTLFGPIDPRWSKSHHPRAIDLLHPVDCGPCGKMVCPFEHHRCMRDLKVDRVLAAVRQQLRGSDAHQAAA